MDPKPGADRGSSATPPEPLFGWDKSDRDALCAAFASSGWHRFLPVLGTQLFEACVTAPVPPDLGALEHRLDLANEGEDPWSTPAWESLTEFTDDELAAHEECFASTDEVPTTAEEVNAQERIRRERAIIDLERNAAGLGRPPVRTARDLLDLLLAAHLLFVSKEDDTTVYRPVRFVPLVDEVFVLDESTRAREDRLRWQSLHLANTQRIMRLFLPCRCPPPGEIVTSLEQLATHLDIDVESAREALTILLEVGDITTPVDISRAHAPETLQLRAGSGLSTRARVRARTRSGRPTLT